jgi:hypothetical protein
MLPVYERGSTLVKRKATTAGNLFVQEGHQLIDGRNRLKACKLAGVEPRFQKLDGTDPVAFIYSANINRRDLTKSQRAMLIAKRYPEPERGRGKKDEARKETETVSFTRVKEARQVLRYSKPLADAVIRGTKSLDEALEIVKKAQEREKSDEENLAVLRKEAADLADLVDEGKPRHRVQASGREALRGLLPEG